MSVSRFASTICTDSLPAHRRGNLGLYVMNNEIHHRGHGYVCNAAEAIEPPAFRSAEPRPSRKSILTRSLDGRTKNRRSPSAETALTPRRTSAYIAIRFLQVRQRPSAIGRVDISTTTEQDDPAQATTRRA